MGFSFNKGFVETELFKLNKFLYSIFEIDGKPFNIKKHGRSRDILYSCSECGALRKTRIVDFLVMQTSLCKSCIKKGERNTAKLEYVKKKISEADKDLSYLTPEFREKFSKKRMGVGNPMFGRKRTDRAKKLTSISHKKKFLDEKFCLEFGQRFNKRPNKPETIINNLLENIYGNKYLYTGDFKFFIGGKNPDFIDKSNKKIIEVFGTYWHNIDEELPRINHFLKYGYSTLIIWENELKNLKRVVEKVINFDDEVKK